jgi:glycosyltransferase involved in cell wall biosynthesis
MINYSFIIPHFNIPDLLRRCIKSIPQRDDVQIIVVDDNSPNSEEYVSTIPELSNKNVEFYITKAGKGAGHARNVGLQHAVGKWLIFADSDDFFVEDISSILDEYLNDENDVLFFNIFSCDCYDINRRYPSKKDPFFALYESTGNDMCFRVGCSDPWGKIIKRKFVVENNITFQETRAHNDLLFSVMTGVKARTVGIVNRPMYWYVVREGSLGHQKGKEPIMKIQDRMLAWKSTQEFLEEMDIKTKMYLPTIPFIKAIAKHPYRVINLILASRRAGCNSALIIFEVIRYMFRMFFSDHGLMLYQEIYYKK